MSVELERRAFLKAAAAACVAVRTPYALAAWCSPSKMKEMEADEAGGKSTKELEALLDAVERTYAGRPYLVIRTRYMMTMFDNVRVCLAKNHEFAYWTLDKGLVGKRTSKRIQQFLASSPRRRFSRKDSNGAFMAILDRSHTCPDWESLLKLGPSGIVARAQERLKTAKNQDEEVFLKCVVELYKAFSRLLVRWGNFAEKKGKTAVAAALKAVAERPPRTLREALQLGLVYDHCQEMEGELVRNQGLFDRLYIDFYRRDLAEGRETRETAKALVRDWFLRLYSLNSGNPGKNVGLGGYDAAGKPVWNELTEIAFELHDELANPSPKLSYRLGKNTPREQLERVVRCIADGRTSVVFANDDVLGESFRRRGKTPEDIANYVLIGCYEPGIMGREIIASMSCQINLVKPLEAVFNNGRDFAGFRVGPDCTLPQDAAAFEREYLRQTDAVLERMFAATRFLEEHWCDLNPSPFLSGAYRDCIANAADMSLGGAKYNQSGCVCLGLPTVADSLAAIHYLVDEAKLVTMSELGDILRADWKGREELRLKAVRSAPKWGNNDDRADQYAQRVQRAVARRVNAAPNGHGGTYQAGFWTIDLDKVTGQFCAATADGRHAGDLIARNSSATAGCGHEGPTALMLSSAKLDLADAPDGHILDVILPMSLSKRTDGVATIAAMIQSYFCAGGQCLNINCFDAALLRDAMAHPEKYPDLQVRVCGWNVRWNSLSHWEQEHFLRTALAQESRSL